MSNQRVVQMSETQRKKYRFTPEQFCQVYRDSKSTEEVMGRLSALVGEPVPRSVVLSRAAAYKKKGAKLKKMPSGRNINIGRLNEIIEEATASA